MHVSGIGEETADSIAGWEKSVDLAAELKRIADFHAHVVIQSDAEYPEQLRHIYDPPLVLYVRGRLLPRDKNAVARYRAVGMTGRFAEIMGKRFSEGGVTDVEPAMAAIAITAMTERMWHQIRTWNVEIDREVVIDALATMAMKMLHPKVVVSG